MVVSGDALGAVLTDAAWGVTRGFFENLTVGVRVLDLPAAFGWATTPKVLAPPVRTKMEGGGLVEEDGY